MKTAIQIVRVTFLSLFVCLIGSAAHSYADTNDAITPNFKLWVALENLNMENVSAALQEGADPNARHPFGFSGADRPLGEVCEGLKKTVESSEDTAHGYLDRTIVLQQDAEPGKERSLGTLVWDNDKSKAVEIAQLLFSKGAKRETFGDDLECPISLGATGLISLLLEHGVMPNNKYGQYTDTQFAKMYEQEKIYDLLIAHGGTPVDEHTANQLVLTKAVDLADVNMIARALGAGAQINSSDPGGTTALCAAIKQDYREYKDYVAIWWLLDHGAVPPRNCPNGVKIPFVGLPGAYSLPVDPVNAFFLELAERIKSPKVDPQMDEMLTRLLGQPIKTTSQELKSPEKEFLINETLTRLKKAGGPL